MAIITCKECNNQISETAKKCPQCGAINVAKLRQDYIAGAAVIIFVLAVWYLYPNENITQSTQLETEVTVIDQTEKATQHDEYKEQEMKKAREKVKQLYLSDEEPTAKDALWTMDSIFKVGVINNGSPMNGYAESVCLTLYDYGFKGEKVWVQIIDIAKVVNEQKFVKLGEAHCS